MNPQIIYIANAFYALAAMLGFPALLGLIASIVFGVRLWLMPIPPASAPTKNPDAIILMLEGITRAVGFGAGIISGLGKMAVTVIGAVSIVALISAVMFFYAGRGLHAQSGYARGVAAGLLIVMLLFWLLALLSLRMPIRLVPALFAAATIYALWTLWKGYAV